MKKIYKSDTWNTGNSLTKFYEVVEDCPICYGMGELDDGEECPNCDGKGKIISNK